MKKTVIILFLVIPFFILAQSDTAKQINFGNTKCFTKNFKASGVFDGRIGEFEKLIAYKYTSQTKSRSYTTYRNEAGFALIDTLGNILDANSIKVDEQFFDVSISDMKMYVKDGSHYIVGCGNASYLNDDTSILEKAFLFAYKLNRSDSCEKDHWVRFITDSNSHYIHFNKLEIIDSFIYVAGYDNSISSCTFPAFKIHNNKRNINYKSKATIQKFNANTGIYISGKEVYKNNSLFFNEFVDIKKNENSIYLLGNFSSTAFVSFSLLHFDTALNLLSNSSLFPSAISPNNPTGSRLANSFIIETNPITGGLLIGAPYVKFIILSNEIKLNDSDHYVYSNSKSYLTCLDSNLTIYSEHSFKNPDSSKLNIFSYSLYSNQDQTYSFLYYNDFMTNRTKGSSELYSCRFSTPLSIYKNNVTPINWMGLNLPQNDNEVFPNHFNGLSNLNIQGDLFQVISNNINNTYFLGYTRADLTCKNKDTLTFSATIDSIKTYDLNSTISTFTHILKDSIHFKEPYELESKIITCVDTLASTLPKIIGLPLIPDPNKNDSTNETCCHLIVLEIPSGVPCSPFSIIKKKGDFNLSPVINVNLPSPANTSSNDTITPIIPTSGTSKVIIKICFNTIDSSGVQEIQISGGCFDPPTTLKFKCCPLYNWDDSGGPDTATNETQIDDEEDDDILSLDNDETCDPYGNNISPGNGAANINCFALPIAYAGNIINNHFVNLFNYCCEKTCISPDSGGTITLDTSISTIGDLDPNKVYLDFNSISCNKEECTYLQNFYYLPANLKTKPGNIIKYQGQLSSITSLEITSTTFDFEIFLTDSRFKAIPITNGYKIIKKYGPIQFPAIASKDFFYMYNPKRRAGVSGCNNYNFISKSNSVILLSKNYNVNIKCIPKTTCTAFPIYDFSSPKNLTLNTQTVSLTRTTDDSICSYQLDYKNNSTQFLKMMRIRGVNSSFKLSRCNSKYNYKVSKDNKNAIIYALPEGSKLPKTSSTVNLIVIEPINYRYNDPQEIEVDWIYEYGKICICNSEKIKLEMRCPIKINCDSIKILKGDTTTDNECSVKLNYLNQSDVPFNSLIFGVNTPPSELDLKVYMPSPSLAESLRYRFINNNHFVTNFNSQKQLPNGYSPNFARATLIDPTIAPQILRTAWIYNFKEYCIQNHTLYCNSCTKIVYDSLLLSSHPSGHLLKIKLRNITTNTIRKISLITYDTTGSEITIFNEKSKITDIDLKPNQELEITFYSTLTIPNHYKYKLVLEGENVYQANTLIKCCEIERNK